MPFGFMAVAPREDANVNVRLVHYFERLANGVGIARGKMFHADGKDALPQASIDDLFTMPRQVNRRATDHCGELARLVYRVSAVVGSEPLMVASSRRRGRKQRSLFSGSRNRKVPDTAKG